MSGTYFAPALSLMLNLARENHIAPDPLLKKLGIDSKLITDPNARFDMGKVNRFFQQVADLIPDAGFALAAGSHWHPSQLGALGYGWMTSSTLRTGFNRLIRFTKILNDELNIELVETGSSLEIRHWFKVSDKVPRFRTDGAMAALMAMIRFNTDSSFQPDSVTFSYAEPEDTGDHYKLFQCPISFGEKYSAIVISTHEVDELRSCSNSQLSLLNDQILVKYLAKLDKDNIVEQVKATIMDQLSSGATNDLSIASVLLMSKRTLQRRLNDNDTTFKELLNEVRHELANKYILDSSLPVTEISYLLGFSETSSFTRAFKRWSGQSPTEFRSMN